MNSNSKKCTKCKKVLPLNRFSQRLKGLQPVCKDCVRDRNLEYYNNNKSSWRETRKRRTERLRKDALEYIEPLKRRPCHDCGGVFDPVCMDFDHRDPATKTHTISWLTRGAYLLETIKEEVAKCDLVCSNCHRIRTAKRGKYYKPAGRRVIPEQKTKEPFGREIRFKRRTKKELEMNTTPETIPVILAS